MMSAAAMATRVRVNCDDISCLPFRVPRFLCRLMALPNQGACQWRETRENVRAGYRMAHFPNQLLVTNAKPRLGNIRRARRVEAARGFVRSKRHDRQAVRCVA